LRPEQAVSLLLLGLEQEPFIVRSMSLCWPGYQAATKNA